MPNPAIQKPQTSPSPPATQGTEAKGTEATRTETELETPRTLLRNLKVEGIDLSSLGFKKESEIQLPDKTKRQEQQGVLRALRKFTPSPTADTANEKVVEQLRYISRSLKEKNSEAAKLFRQLANLAAKSSLDTLDETKDLADHSPIQAKALDGVAYKASERFYALRKQLAEEHGYFVNDSFMRENPRFSFEMPVSSVYGILKVANGDSSYSILFISDKKLVPHGFTTGQPTTMVVNLSKHLNEFSPTVDVRSTIANELAHGYLVGELGLSLSSELPDLVASYPNAPASIDRRAARKLGQIELNTRRVHELFSDTWSAKLGGNDTRRLVKNTISQLVYRGKDITEGDYLLSEAIVEAVIRSRDRKNGSEQFAESIKELRQGYSTVRSFTATKNKFKRIDEVYAGYQAFEKLTQQRIAQLREKLVDQVGQPKAQHATRLQLKAQQALIEARHSSALSRMTEIAGDPKMLAKMRDQTYRDEVNTQTALALASWITLQMVTEMEIMNNIGEDGLKEIAKAIDYYGTHFHDKLLEAKNERETE